MNDYHSNIFNHYSQKDALPIENNSTRNLAIVLNNNQLAFERFLDLIGKEINSTEPKIHISKPNTTDEQFVDIQVSINSLIKQDIPVKQVIGIALTTEIHEFYSTENDNTKNNITDMVLYSNETLVIIEAKRNQVDATKQLQGQVNQYIQGVCFDSDEFEIEPFYLSITWDQIVYCLKNVNDLINESDPILRDYLEHIRRSVPSFFPVQPFAKLRPDDSEHIQRRIERAVENLGADNSKPTSAGINTGYRIDISSENKKYLKEMALMNYNSNLSLSFHPGNNIGQGWHLYSGENKLSILKMNSINIDGHGFDIIVFPNIKLASTFGKWHGEVKVATNDLEVLMKLYRDIAASYTKKQLPDIYETLEKYDSIINHTKFEENFQQAFGNDTQNAFVLSLSLGISVKGLFDYFQEIDTSINPTPENDPIVPFLKEALNKVCYYIEN